MNTAPSNTGDVDSVALPDLASFLKAIIAVVLCLAVTTCGFSSHPSGQKSKTVTSASTRSVDTGRTIIEEQFGTDELGGWKERSFRGNSNYRSVVVDGRTALEASTDGTASLFFKQRTIDLNETPIIQWSWKISGVYATDGAPEERKKSGDDFPARIYVVYQPGILPSQAKAINYVWSSKEPVGAQWPNPFSKNARMVVVASGSEQQGEWVTLQRNVRQDFKDIHGIDTDTLHGYAVMVDGDNTGSATTSWFDFIRFKEESSDPPS